MSYPICFQPGIVQAVRRGDYVSVQRLTRRWCCLNSNVKVGSSILIFFRYDKLNNKVQPSFGLTPTIRNNLCGQQSTILSQYHMKRFLYLTEYQNILTHRSYGITAIQIWKYPVFEELDSPFHILSLSEKNKNKTKKPEKLHFSN